MTKKGQNGSKAKKPLDPIFTVAEPNRVAVVSLTEQSKSVKVMVVTD